MRVKCGGVRGQTRLKADLLGTSVLTAAAVAVSGSSVLAAEKADKWHGHAETVLRPGSEETAGSLEVFLPVAQDEDTLFFLDLRLSANDITDYYGNWGAGVRQVVAPDLILGMSAFLDAKRSDDDNSFTAFTIGAEALTSDFDARVNVHLPLETGAKGVLDTAPAGGGGLSIVDNRLVETFGGLRIDEFAMYGVEGEVGVRLPFELNTGDEFRVFAGGYHYWSSHVEDISGVRGRVEYRINDVFGVAGAQFNIGGEITHDNYHGTEGSAELRLRLPFSAFFGGSSETAAVSPAGYRPIDMRMTERVRRDTNIVTRRRTTDTSTTAPAINPATGAVFGGVYFVDGANSAGDGSQADPTTLDDAVFRAADDGIIVALGGLGNIATGGVTLADGQFLVGGGSSVVVQLNDGTNTAFSFTGSNGTIAGTNPAANVIALADGNTLQDITVTGGATGISGSDIAGATISDVTVENTGGDGVAFTGTTSGVSADNLTVTGVGDIGITIVGDGNYSFTGITTVLNPAFDGINITGDGNYTFEVTDVTTTAGDGIEVTSTTGMFSNTGGIIDATGGTAVKFDPLAIDATFASLSATGGMFGIQLDDVTGSFTVTGATSISNTTSDGISITNSDVAVTLNGATTISNAGGNGFSIHATAGSVTVNGAVAVANSSVDGIVVTGSDTDVTFNGAVTVTNSGGDGIAIISSAGGFAASAAVTVDGAGSRGILLTDNSAAVGLTGAVLVSGTGIGGIRVQDNAGTSRFGDTAIDAPGTAGIVLSGTNGAVTFGDVDITGLVANTTGVDLSMSNGQVTFETLDISASSAVGTRGIDLTGATNGSDVMTVESGTITGVGIGVDLTNASMTGNFQYGDGSNTDADGAASTIDAVTPIEIAGLNAANGIYDFEDVNLIGDVTALSSNATLFYVDTTPGAGTASDPGSLAQAELSGADAIVLVNDGTNGGLGTIDAAGSNGDDTFVLQANQQVVSFLNSSTALVGGGAPLNLLLNGIAPGIVSDPTGNGAPDLITSASASTITLADGNRLAGIAVDDGTGSPAVSGSTSDGVIIEDSQVERLSLIASTGTATVDASTLETLFVSGGDVGVMATSATLSNSMVVPTVFVNSGHTGTVSFDAGSAITASNGSGLQFDDADGTYMFHGPVSLNGGDAGIDILNGSSGTFTFADVTITSPVGPAFTLANSTASVDITGGSITQANNAAAVDITGHSGGTVTFGATIGASNGSGLQFDDADGTYMFDGPVSLNGGDAGIDILNGSSGTFTFADVTITSPMGPAFTLANSTASVDIAGGSITQANNAAAVDITGHSGGTVTFGATIGASNGSGLQFDDADGSYMFDGPVSLNGGDAGIDILNGSAGTFTFADLTITNPSGAAFSIQDSTANVDVLGGAITQNNSVTGVELIGNTGGTVDIGAMVTTSTGGARGIDIFNNAGATFTFSGSLDIDTTTGLGLDAQAGGTINITGPGNTIDSVSGQPLVLNGITIGNDGITFDAITALGSSGDGITISNVTQSGSSGFAVSGATTVTGPASTGIFITNTSADIAFNGATSISDTGLSGVYLSANPGDVFFADLTVTNPTGSTLSFEKNTGNVDIAGGALSMTAGGGRGIDFDSNSGNITVGSTIDFDSASPQGIFLQGNAGDVTFDGTVEITNSRFDSIWILNNTGTTTFNSAVTIADSGTEGIDARLNAGDVFFGDAVTITDAAGAGIQLADNTAGFAFGEVTITNPTTAGIDFQGSNAGATFGDVTMSNLGAVTGVDLNGATLTGAVNFASLDVTGTGAAGSVGIDLTNVVGNQVVRFGTVAAGDSTTDTPSSIVDVERGVVISDTSSVQFTFGDGFDSLDTASTIDVTAGGFTIDAPGGTLAGSSFDFDDVTFGAGDDPNFPILSTIQFVSQTGGVLTAGTFGLSSDITTISLADADALTGGQTFAFIGSIDTTGLGADGFNLDSTQNVTGFANGNAVAFGLAQPANITGSFGLLGGTLTANSAVITNSSAGNDVFTLGGDNTIDNNTFELAAGAGRVFNIDGTAAGFLNGTGITIENSIIQNVGATGTVFGVTNVNDMVAVQNNDINVAGRLANVDGGSGDVGITQGTGATLTAGDVFIGNKTGGTASLDGSLVLNAPVAAGIDLSGNTNTAISFGGSATLNGSGILVSGGTGGSVVFDGPVTSSSPDINGLRVDGGTTSAVTFNDSLSIFSPAGPGIDVNNSNAVFTFAGLTTVNSTSAFAFADTITLLNNAGSTFNFTGGLQINHDRPNILLETHAIRANNAGELNITGAGNSIFTDGLGLLNLSDTTIGAGGITFNTLQSFFADPGPVVRFSNVDGGVFNAGSVLVIGGPTTDDGILIENDSSATFNFNNVNIGSVRGSAIRIANSGTGAINFNGTTGVSSTDPAVHISGTVAGPVYFADLDINLIADNRIGIYLADATLNGNLTIDDLELASTSATGTTGINLSGTTGTGTLQIGDAVVGGANDANISGVNDGVLFSSTTNINLVFGDGENTADVDSSISAVTPINHDGSGLPTSGSYDFDDVTLTGDTSALEAISVYYIDQVNGGTGTAADPGTIAGAEASTANVYVLLDTNVDGASDSIDASVQNTGSLNLPDNAALIAYNSGSTAIDVTTLGLSPGGAPASFSFNGINNSTTVAVPTGLDSVSPTLTTSGANNTMTLGGSAGIGGVQIANGGTGIGIAGAFAVNETVTIDSSSIGGSSWGLDFAPTGGTTTLDIINTTFTSGISLDGSGAGSITATATGTNSVTITGSDRVLDFNTATIGGAGITFSSLTQTIPSAGTDPIIELTNVSGGAFNGGAVNLAGSTGASIFAISNSSNNTTLSSLSLSNGAVDGLLLNGNSGSFTVTGATTVDGSSTGINIQNNPGAYTFGDVTINNRLGAGIAINAFTGGAQTGTFGTVTINNQNNSATTALAIDNAVTGGSTITIAGVAIDNNGSNSSAIALSNNDGATININGGSVQNAAGAAVSVSTSSGTATYAGTINNTAGRSVQVLNNTGGTTTFSGAITGTGTGVLVNNNTGATVNFTGGMTLTTGTNDAFTATGGGTVTVQGASNTVTTTTGTGVLIQNTNIGTAGVTFASVNSNGIGGGTTGGIFLENTGTLLGSFFTVNGGTIQNAEGADLGAGAVSPAGDGIGVYLENVQNATLNGVTISNSQNFGIRAFNLSGTTTFSNVTLSGTHGTAATSDEAAVSLDNIAGTLNVTSGAYGGGHEDNFAINNTSGVLTANFTGVTFNTNSATTGDNGLQFITSGSATGNLNVNGSTFNGARSVSLFADLGGAGGGTVNIGNTVANTFTQGQVNLPGGGAIEVLASGTGNVSAVNTVISNNNITAGANTYEGDVIVTGTGFGYAGTHNLTISGNTIGTAGVNGSAVNPAAGSGDSGIVVSQNGTGTMNVLIDNNNVFDYNGSGIEIFFDAEGPADPNGGTLNLTITNNTVQDAVGSTGANAAIFILGDDNVDTCMNITGNTLNDPGNPEIEVDVFGDAGATFAVVGLTDTGGAAGLDETDIERLWALNNGGLVAGTDTNVFSLAPSTISTSPGCTQP